MHYFHHNSHHRIILKKIAQFPNVTYLKPTVHCPFFHEKKLVVNFCGRAHHNLTICRGEDTPNETHVPCGKGKALECFIISVIYSTI